MVNRLKIGLEVHVQLNTGKLFCRCPVEWSEEGSFELHRKLRPASGESGAVDRAARYEEERDRSFTYLCPENTCLVEYDEEPPRPVNQDALLTALKVAASLKCSILPAIECMRKIVIDGSNTSGFQRTSLVAVNGSIDTSKGKVGITSVCLEEDSARKISDSGDSVRYSLGRLGIPLIEITTDPDIVDEDHAIEVARKIGLTAMTTGMARRDSDSIRQDVNLSMGHGRVEIKGISRISQIKEAIESEIDRQLMLEKVASTIHERGGFQGSLHFLDISSDLLSSGSSLISKGLKEGKHVFLAKLDKMAGVLKSQDMRLGREIADLTKVFAVQGILHSDELPGYGLTSDDVKILSKKAGCSELDAFMLVITSKNKASILESEIPARIQNLLDLRLDETRSFSDQGRTTFLRPLPGAERMYPETDLEPIRLSSEDIKSAEEFGRLSAEERVNKLASDYKISFQDASTLVTDAKLGLFLSLSGILSPRYSARLILQRLPEIEKKSGKSFDDKTLIDLVNAIKGRSLGEVSVDAALELLSKGHSLKDIVNSENIKPLSDAELFEVVREILPNILKGNPGELIASVKKRTSRPFDPRDVMRMYESMKMNLK
ncbi:MAG: Glu-tRNA(Gln) amidotransferase subunit GatE [Candidatus Thermoplasmatota archaeon]|nr:Glu-tRNA(Gln) amidotransferase subunit GatE [Candidatus Thermoplasmatota archaeon]